jgi:alpha-galactosidase
MSQLKIVIVGGGSNAWTPMIVKDMLLTPELRGASFVLYDINKAASDLAKAGLERIAREINVTPKLISTDNRKKAFDGANYFIVTISTGGLDAMAHDLSIPEKYSIYHTVGDTSGPGGWARAIRNFDVFVKLAEDINRHAPGAMVLNYTNPMTTLTDVLSRLCKGPVVGLCHGLFENLTFIKKLYKLDSEDRISARFAGINHFFWITQATAGGIDVISDLQKRLTDGSSFTQMQKEITPDAMGFHSKREVATELFRLTGAFTYLGDRHTCEFLPWIITNKKNMAKYQIVRTSIADRKAAFARRETHLKGLAAGKPMEDYYRRRSRETAADIIAAHTGGKTFIDVGNVVNTGQITNLPLGLVVETPVRVDARGFTPLQFGDLPPAPHALISPYATLFPMVIDACFKRDLKMAMRALRLDPVCSHLNGDQIQQLGEKLLGAHKAHITAFG